MKQTSMMMCFLFVASDVTMPPPACVRSSAASSCISSAFRLLQLAMATDELQLFTLKQEINDLNTLKCFNFFQS